MKYVKLYEDFIAEEEFFKGGVANGMTPEDLAKTHKVSVDVIKAALEKGVEIKIIPLDSTYIFSSVSSISSNEHLSIIS